MQSVATLRLKVAPESNCTWLCGVIPRWGELATAGSVLGSSLGCAPLTDLLRKDRLLVWADAEDKATKTLIAHLTFASVLALPDFDKHFFLTADASDAAVGVMLSQQADESKKHHIIACYSHRFTRTELCYPERKNEI